MSVESGHAEGIVLSNNEIHDAYPRGTVLEMVGVVVEPTQAQGTPASHVPHTVPTTSGEGYARIQDDQHESYFTDE